jgi:hypothetical protein
MNPFQSIANYLNNDLYRWEDDEERKRRYDEMYPMGDAHLGTWDELSRARVRRAAEDTGPPGYDASIQDNVLETKTVTTPTGTTITKKLAPSPVGNAEPNLPTSFGMPSRNAAHVQSMRDRHYGYNRGEPDLPVSWSMPPSVSNVEPNLRTQFPAPAAPSPDVAYPFEGSQGTSMRQGGDMMHALALQAAANNQKPPQANPIYPYEGPQGRPMFNPDVVGPAAAHARALQASVMGTQQPVVAQSPVANVEPNLPTQFPMPAPTYPDAGGMQLQNRNEGQIRADLEAERNRISRLERERAATARAMNVLTRDQAASEEARATPAYNEIAAQNMPWKRALEGMIPALEGLSKRSELVEEPITGDVYTDAVIDFVGRDAEKDERGMKGWYSQMAREAIRKFNKLPTGKAATPVYKKKKKSFVGPPRPTKRKRN